MAQSGVGAAADRQVLGETIANKATSKQSDVRASNITAAKAVLDLIRTSLGPKGLDKMIMTSKGDVLITNDGATIMKQLEARHPAARMLVDVSQSQDIEAGDGTTSVVVLTGALLSQCPQLFELGIHPTVISEAFEKASLIARSVINKMARPVDLNEMEVLVKNAKTSLASKVISQHAEKLAPLAVNAVLSVRDPHTSNVDLRNIRIVKSIGGTLDDCELIDGVVFKGRTVHQPAPTEGGKAPLKNPKILVAQFPISPPKPDIDSTVTLRSAAAMDSFLRQGAAHVARICRRIKTTGADIVIVQKSILREAVSDLAVHYLTKKLGITVVADVDRAEIPYVCKATGATPIATVSELESGEIAKFLGTCGTVRSKDGLYCLDGCKAARLEMLEKLRLAEKAEAEGEEADSSEDMGLIDESSVATFIVRGSSALIVDECERSLHDSMCVVRSLIKLPMLLPGGGCTETEIAARIRNIASGISTSTEGDIKKFLDVTVSGADAICLNAYADALEVIPTTLAENAGLNPLRTLTELRQRHGGENTDEKLKGLGAHPYAGVDCNTGNICDDMADCGVVQPALVTHSAINFATETARMILKIDDLVLSMN